MKLKLSVFDPEKVGWYFYSTNILATKNTAMQRENYPHHLFPSGTLIMMIPSIFIVLYKLLKVLHFSHYSFVPKDTQRHLHLLEQGFELLTFGFMDKHSYQLSHCHPYQDNDSMPSNTFISTFFLLVYSSLFCCWTH